MGIFPTRYAEMRSEGIANIIFGRRVYSVSPVRFLSLAYIQSRCYGILLGIPVSEMGDVVPDSHWFFSVSVPVREAA